MALVDIKRFDIYLVSLDPTVGFEIKKTRPCVVVSPDVMNSLKTVIVAPMTTKGFQFPTRVPITFQQKKGMIVLDQIRAIDKCRLVTRVGSLRKPIIRKLLNILEEMFVE